MELVGRLLILGQSEDGVLEGQQRAGVDLEGEMEIEGSAAAVLRVEFDLPDLAQGVRLDEVTLVVHVEAVVHGMVLQVGHVSGHVDDSHSAASLFPGCDGQDRGSTGVLR